MVAEGEKKEYYFDNRHQFSGNIDHLFIFISRLFCMTGEKDAFDFDTFLFLEIANRKHTNVEGNFCLRHALRIHTHNIHTSNFFLSSSSCCISRSLGLEFSYSAILPFFSTPVFRQEQG
jgi:hypothetical protein